jgi:hypothetical protein
VVVSPTTIEGRAVLTETVVPGVGLWTAGLGRLEGSPERVRMYSFKESVRHLILNVHDPAEVRETLRQSKFADIETLELNFFEGCAFPGLAWALQLTVIQPREIIIRGLDEDIERWQYLCLWDTCKCTHQATINGINSPPNLEPGVVILGEWDEWYRVFPCGKVAVPSFYIHLIPPGVKKLVVDMEETEHPFTVPDTVEELTIWSIPRRRFTDILTIVRSGNFKKFTFGGGRGMVGLRELMALEARCSRVEYWP